MISPQDLQALLLQAQAGNATPDVPGLGGFDLASLFAGGAGGGATPSAAPAPSVDPRQAIIDQAFKYTPTPVPEDKKPWQKGLASALAAIGAALQARGGMTPRYDAVNMLVDLRKRREDAMAANAAGQGAASRAKALYGLSQQDKAAQEKAQAAAEADRRAFELGRDKTRAQQNVDLATQERIQRENEARIQRDFQIQQDKIRADREMELQVLKGKQDMQQIRARTTGEDKVLNRQTREVQLRDLKDVKKYALGIASNLQEGLSKHTPDEIRQMFLDQVDVAGLAPDLKAEAMQTFMQRVEPALRQAEAAALAQGPTAPTMTPQGQADYQKTVGQFSQPNVIQQGQTPEELAKSLFGRGGF